MIYAVTACAAVYVLFSAVCGMGLRGRENRGFLCCVLLCLLADLLWLLPRILAHWDPELPWLWTGLGALLEAVLVTACWLLLYLLWERRYGGEARDGLSFWTAVGGALARLLLCAASARNWLRGGEARVWPVLRLLPLCFLAAAVVTVWRSVRRGPARRLWLLLIAALALRLLSVGLDPLTDPLLLRLPLLAVHGAIAYSLRRTA